MPEHPHTEYDHPCAPGEVGVAVQWDCQDVPAKLDLYESLADESGKYQPREPTNPSIRVPITTNKIMTDLKYELKDTGFFFILMLHLLYSSRYEIRMFLKKKLSDITLSAVALSM